MRINSIAKLISCMSLPFLSVSFLFVSCNQPEKEEPIAAYTFDPQSITCTSAVLLAQAKIPKDIALDLSIGIMYSTSPVVLATNSISVEAENFDSQSNYSITLNDLNPGTVYYYRAFVFMSNTYHFGEIKKFTTEAINVECQTLPVETPNFYSLVLNGRIMVEDRFSSLFDRLDKSATLLLSTNPVPTQSNSMILEVGVFPFQRTMSKTVLGLELEPNTDYYYRYLVEYSVSPDDLSNYRTVYGNIESFRTNEMCARYSKDAIGFTIPAPSVISSIEFTESGNAIIVDGKNVRISTYSCSNWVYSVPDFGTVQMNSNSAIIDFGNYYHYTGPVSVRSKESSVFYSIASRTWAVKHISIEVEGPKMGQNGVGFMLDAIPNLGVPLGEVTRWMKNNLGLDISGDYSGVILSSISLTASGSLLFSLRDDDLVLAQIAFNAPSSNTVAFHSSSMYGTPYFFVNTPFDGSFSIDYKYCFLRWAGRFTSENDNYSYTIELSLQSGE